MTDISAIGPKELSVQLNHFNHALWVAIRCEASEATC